MIPIDELPQFDVQHLLEEGLRKLNVAAPGSTDSRHVQAARDELTAVLASMPQSFTGTRPDTERLLRRMARTLLRLKDPQLESAGLAIMSAADMLRVV